MKTEDLSPTSKQLKNESRSHATAPNYLVLCRAEWVQEGGESPTTSGEELECLVQETISEALRSEGSPLQEAALQDALRQANARLGVACKGEPSNPAVSTLLIAEGTGPGEFLVLSSGAWTVYGVRKGGLDEAFRGTQAAEAILNGTGSVQVSAGKVSARGYESLMVLDRQATARVNTSEWAATLSKGDKPLLKQIKALCNNLPEGEAWLISQETKSMKKPKSVMLSAALLLLAFGAVFVGSMWIKQRHELVRKATPSAHTTSDTLKSFEPMSTDREQSLSLEDAHIELERTSEIVEEVERLEAMLLDLDETETVAVEDFNAIEELLAKETAQFHQLETALKEEHAEVVAAQAALAERQREMQELEGLLVDARNCVREREKQMVLMNQQEEKLLQRLAEREAENEGLAQEVQEMMLGQSDKDASIRVQREEIAALSKKTQELENTCQERAAALAQLSQDLEERATALAAIDAERAMLADQSASLAELVSAQESVIAAAQIDQEKLAILEKDHEAVLNQCAQLGDLMIEQETALEEGRKAKEALALLEADHAAVIDQCAQLGEIVLERDAAMLAQEEAQTQLKEARLGMTDQLQELVQSQQEMWKEKEALETEMHALREQVLEQEKTLALAEQSQATTLAGLRQVEGWHDQLVQEKEELQTQLANMARFEREYERERTLREERDEMLVRLNANVHGWREAVTSLEDSRTALAEELDELKKQRAAKPVASSTEPTRLRRSRPAVQAQPSSVTRIHLVSAGETLDSISRRYYGTSKRVADLFEANKDAIPSADSIRVGTALIIPE